MIPLNGGGRAHYVECDCCAGLRAAQEDVGGGVHRNSAVLYCVGLLHGACAAPDVPHKSALRAFGKAGYSYVVGGQVGAYRAGRAVIDPVAGVACWGLQGDGVAVAGGYRGVCGVVAIKRAYCDAGGSLTHTVVGTSGYFDRVSAFGFYGYRPMVGRRRVVGIFRLADFCNCPRGGEAAVGGNRQCRGFAVGGGLDVNVAKSRILAGDVPGLCEGAGLVGGCPYIGTLRVDYCHLGVVAVIGVVSAPLACPARWQRSVERERVFPARNILVVSAVGVVGDVE